MKSLRSGAAGIRGRGQVISKEKQDKEKEDKKKEKPKETNDG